jgi:hypothetical protein
VATHEETIVKHALLGGVFVVALANVAAAQGTNIHSCYGGSGSEFSLAADTQTFNYTATISGTTVAYVATLDVFHNGVRKGTYTQVVALPPVEGYRFSAAVDLSQFGLNSGDNVTFRLSVTGLTFGKLMGVHTLLGLVAPPEKQTTN